MLRPCLGSLALIGDVSLGDRTGEFKAYVQEVALLAADQLGCILESVEELFKKQ